MDYKDITVGIVTYKSKKVLFKCLKSIKKIKKIIIFDNSNDEDLKREIKFFNPKIKFVLSKKNLGYGNGNNKIINVCKTRYLFVLNPDTVLDKNCEKELLKTIKLKEIDFSILSPISKDKNFGVIIKNKKILKNNLIQTNYVKGFAMLFDIKKITKIGMFDKNIFLYLEEIDLCKRLTLKKQKILINNKAKIFHKGAKSSDIGFEFEKCRNWHWMWSKVYYEKKYSNKFIVYFKYITIMILILFKIILFLPLNNSKKINLNYLRLSGSFNALIGKSSWYRPV
tara:strand:+ start:1079 stop:1924 length:846 start_codon:yes stop_codon:yes gene_type:complete